MMNIAELKGEKTFKTLAKRLLAEPSKKKTNAEMESALLRLNPQLSQIGDLEKGTPILVPDEFVFAADESFTPPRPNGGFVATGPGGGVEITGYVERANRALCQRSRSRAKLVKKRASESVCSPADRARKYGLRVFQ